MSTATTSSPSFPTWATACRRSTRVTATGLREWYKSDQPVFFTLFTRDSQWQVSFWDSSPAFPASSTWTQASFVTSVIPAGINGLAFGLTLGSNGNLTVDDASFDDAAASGGSDSTPPTVS